MNSVRFTSLFALTLCLAPPVMAAGQESPPLTAAVKEDLGDGRFAVTLGTLSPGEQEPLLWEPETDGTLAGWQHTGAAARIRLPARSSSTTSVTSLDGDALTLRPLWLGRTVADGRALSLALPAEAAGLRDPASPDRVSYDSVYPGLDEEYRVTSRGLKHDIVLAGPPRGQLAADPAGDLVLAWSLELSEGLVASMDGRPVTEPRQTSESILVRRDDGSLVFRIAPVRLMDSAPPVHHRKPSWPGSMLLEPEAGGHRLEVRVPLGWLLDPERVYPVRIDPTVNVYPGSEPQTGFVTWNQAGFYDRSEGTMVSGTLQANNTSWVEVNAFSRFDTSIIPDTASITQVQLRVWISNHDNPTNPAQPLQMRARACTEDPLSASNRVLFETIETGQVYLTRSIPNTGIAFCRDYYAFFAWNLPAAAVARLEAQLPQDWFALGFTSNIVDDPLFDHLDYMGYPEVVNGSCGFEPFPGSRIHLRVVYDEENRPPVCNAGGPYSAQCDGATTSLEVDGSGSSDPDNDPLFYTWTSDCPSGSFANPSAATTTLTVDSAGVCNEPCTVSLEVSDGQLTSTCESSVVILDTLPPAITTCPDPLSLECSETGGVSSSAPAAQTWAASFEATDACSTPVESNNAPALFPSDCAPGRTTPVEFTATDACLNAASCSSAVTVEDTTPPSLQVPPPRTLECVGPAGVPLSHPDVQSWLDQASASDICSSSLDLVNDAPSSFPSGCPPGRITTVNFEAADECNLETTGSSDLTVQDSTAPALTVPAPLTLECDSQGGIPLTDPRIQAWLASASATDNCGNATLTHDAPGLFPSGCLPGATTSVSFTASDDCGNSTTLTSNVTVVDTTPPDLTLPAPLQLECDAQGGIPAGDPRIQAWLASASATDSCGPATVSHDAPAFFPSGCGPGQTTSVNFTASDDCGNSVTLGSSVTVGDTTPPVLTPPSPLELECDAQGGIPAGDPRIQAWLASASATDNCDGATITHDAPTFFPSGCGPGQATSVNFTARDDCGNATTLSATLTVRDTTPPDLTLPAPLTLECNEQGGVSLSDQRVQDWLASANATDACGVATISHDAPALFPSGCAPGQTTTVSFTASDDCGNTTTLTSTLTVVDTTPPVLTLPAPLTLECSEQGGVSLGDPRVQSWLNAATASDACDGASISHDAPAFLPSGCAPGQTTTVTFTASDDCGNVTSLSSTITVVDTTPPELTPPDPVVLECGEPGGVPLGDPRIQAWLASATASDACDGASITHNAPSLFPSGCTPGHVTIVTFQAADDCGNASVASSSVTVADTLPPDVSALLDPLLPEGPTSPASPLAPAPPCSPPSSGTFRVLCGADDLCDPELEVSAELVVTNHEVTPSGECIEVVESVEVECEEIVEIRLLAPPCPSKPRSAHPAVTVTSEGTKVITGEQVILEVTAADGCGNAATAGWDPTDPMPECEHPLPNGECCPALAPPEPEKCKLPPCGTSGGT